MAAASGFEPYEIPIRSRSVLRVYVGGGFNLQLAENEADETAICIANPLAIVTENDPLVGLSGPAGTASFGKIVVSGRELCESRRLQIIFLPGVWFRVEPSDGTGNGWGPPGSKGLIRVCMPNGEMAIWFGLRKARSA